MSTELNISWATYIIDKYEEEFDCIVKESEIDNTLQVLMEEKDFICEEQKYLEILQELIYTRYH